MTAYEYVTLVEVHSDESDRYDSGQQHLAYGKKTTEYSETYFDESDTLSEVSWSPLGHTELPMPMTKDTLMEWINDRGSELKEACLS